MSNFSKEKVLEWVNSSEARAAKYEQEAKVTEKYDNNNCIGHPYDAFENDANGRKGKLCCQENQPWSLLTIKPIDHQAY